MEKTVVGTWLLIKPSPTITLNYNVTIYMYKSKYKIYRSWGVVDHCILKAFEIKSLFIEHDINRISSYICRGILCI